VQVPHSLQNFELVQELLRVELPGLVLEALALLAFPGYIALARRFVLRIVVAAVVASERNTVDET